MGKAGPPRTERRTLPVGTPPPPVLGKAPILLRASALEEVTETVMEAVEPSVIGGALILVLVAVVLPPMKGLTIRTVLPLLPWKLPVGRYVAFKM
jgi:hypothetical protein